MVHNKKVSIVVPVLNGEKSLPACLRSLKDQTIPTWEVIVVDNGSTDRTAMVAKAFGVTYHYMTEKSRSKARNIGVSLSTGEIICFVDCDIEVPLHLVHEILEAFQNKYISVFSLAVVPKGERFLDEYRRNYKAYLSNGSFLDCFETKRVRPLVNSALMAIRKKYFLAIGGFNESFYRSEDRELSERIYQSAGIMKFKSTPYCNVHFEGGCLAYLRRSFQIGKANEFLYPTKKKRNFNIIMGSQDFLKYGASTKETFFMVLNNALRTLGGLYSKATSQGESVPHPLECQHGSGARNLFMIRFFQDGKTYALSPFIRLFFIDDAIYASHAKSGLQVKITEERARVFNELLVKKTVNLEREDIIDYQHLSYFLSHEILEVLC